MVGSFHCIGHIWWVNPCFFFWAVYDSFVVWCWMMWLLGTAGAPTGWGYITPPPNHDCRLLHQRTSSNTEHCNSFSSLSEEPVCKWRQYSQYWTHLINDINAASSSTAVLSLAVFTVIAAATLRCADSHHLKVLHRLSSCIWKAHRISNQNNKFIFYRDGFWLQSSRNILASFCVEVKKWKRVIQP